MSLAGKEGLKKVALLCADKAEYAKERLGAIKGVDVKRSSPTFNEFVVKLPRNPNEIIGKLVSKGIAPGFPLGRYYEDLGDYMLIAVTEKRSKHEIAMLAEELEEALWS
jgi:glycine dehydrogenase subunit 1